MTVKISREKNRFGNCLRLANNQVEVLVAIDYGPSYETYTDDNILELESLGCLELLVPGEEANHEEIWTILEIPNKYKKLGEE